MRVFVTGATGFIGSAVVRELIEAGHTVTGLARTAEAAKGLEAKGVTPVRGALNDHRSLKKAAGAADGVIHLAFIHGFGGMTLGERLRVIAGGAPGGIAQRFMNVITEADRGAINVIGQALKGSNRPLVTTFGTMALDPGRLGTEKDQPSPQSHGYGRSATEEVVQGWAGRGVRTSIVRLAPSVHGDGDKGFVPQLIAFARKKKLSAYVGDGANHWPGVHRLDAARLYRLALEKGAAGGVYHGVADEGVPFRDIAEVIGKRLGVPVVSKPQAWADKNLGWIGMFVGYDNLASSRITQETLGWRPEHPGLLADLDRPAYFNA
jgi:nucleoside-diphosphate-sugar epimerase